jgi:hypothetical protein
MEKIGKSNEAVKEAREYKEAGFSFTRRTIALASIASIIVLPLFAAVFYPYLPISYGFTESVGGFLFFTDPSDTLVWTTGTGLVLTPMHTHLVYAIAGMYFGSSSVK